MEDFLFMRNISSLELLRFIYANYPLPSKEVGIFCFLVDMWYRSITDTFLLSDVNYTYDNNNFYLIDEKKLSVKYDYGPSYFVNQIIKRVWELQNRDIVFALTKGMLIVSKPRTQDEAYKMFEDVILKELI